MSATCGATIVSQLCPMQRSGCMELHTICKAAFPSDALQPPQDCQVVLPCLVDFPTPLVRRHGTMRRSCYHQKLFVFTLKTHEEAIFNIRHHKFPSGAIPLALAGTYRPLEGHFRQVQTVFLSPKYSVPMQRHAWQCQPLPDL